MAIAWERLEDGLLNPCDRLDVVAGRATLDGGDRQDSKRLGTGKVVRELGQIRPIADVGSVEPLRAKEVGELAGARSSELALGAAFAAKTRQRAGNPAPHTETAAAVLCGMTAATAAAITDECLEDLGPRGSEPAYEVWRARIRERFGP